MTAPACPDCDGDGVRTVTRPHPLGFLDEDVEVDCGTCAGARCERCEGAPAGTDALCADCLVEVGGDHWTCPRCPAHWHRLNQSHAEWAQAIAGVQAAHLARHDRERAA